MLVGRRGSLVCRLNFGKQGVKLDTRYNKVDKDGELKTKYNIQGFVVVGDGVIFR